MGILVSDWRAVDITPQRRAMLALDLYSLGLLLFNYFSVKDGCANAGARVFL